MLAACGGPTPRNTVSSAAASSSAAQSASAAPVGSLASVSASASAAPTASVAGPSADPPLVLEEPADLERRPVIAVYASSGDEFFIGYRAPVNIVYEDGSVVRVEDSVVDGQLTVDVAALRESIASSLAGVPDFSELYRTHHNPTVAIYFRTDQGWVRKMVMGMFESGKLIDEEAKPAPEKFVESLNTLRALSLVNTKEYAPKYLEVLIWPFDHAQEQPVPWPKGVPAPTDFSAPDGKAISHVIESRHASALRKAIQRGVVGLDGRKWAIATRELVPAGMYLKQLQRAFIERDMQKPMK